MLNVEKDQKNSNISCVAKQEQVKQAFQNCSSKTSMYEKIIEFGKTLKGVADSFKTEEYIVEGCQSIVYLHAALNKEGKIHFNAQSDSLISAGLAAVLIKVYNEEFPETILKCPPYFIDELGLIASLTPNRSNGFSNIYLRMKQEGLKLFLNPL